MLAPAQVGAGQPPPKQPLPADARKPDRILREGHSGSVQALAFSPDGRRLASGGYDKSIIVWNLSSGREGFRLEAYKGAATTQQQGMNKEAVTWLAFNSDGTRLVSMEVSGVVRVWDSQARKLLFAINPHRVHYYGGQPVGGSGTVEIWDAATGQKLQSIPAHKMAVGRVSFSRDGRRLITVGQDSNPMMVQGQPGVMFFYLRVSVWDTATWKLEFAVTFPSSGGPGADISADGKWLAVTTGGGATQLFDLEQKKSVAVFASPDAWPGNLAISPDGTFLVQGAQEGIRLWKLAFLKIAPN